MLAQGCRTAPLDHRSTPGVPREIFPALCAVFLEEEGYDSSTATIVLSETRPIFRTFALRVLHDAGAMTPAEAEQDDARDEELEAQFRAMRVEVPAQGGSCRWLLAERTDEEYFGTDELMLELSNVVEDPFASAADSRLGVFVRLSIGGASGASWYWVPLKRAGDSWRVAAVSKLEISDG